MLTKRSALILLAVALVVPLFWWLQIRLRPKDAELPEPLRTGMPSAGLTTQMTAALATYYQVATALTRNDSVEAARYAALTDSLLRRLDLNNGIADTASLPFLETLRNGCADAAAKMINAKILADQRIHFETLSNTYYDLLRAGQFHTIRTYKVYCPMAFNNRGAHWLSPEAEVINPYFGASMLHCGEVKDSMGTSITPK